MLFQVSLVLFGSTSTKYSNESIVVCPYPQPPRSGEVQYNTNITHRNIYTSDIHMSLWHIRRSPVHSVRSRSGRWGNPQSDAGLFICSAGLAPVSTTVH
ncbi:hypothetical protein BKA61DRAFT_2317 [Leptodontidium sp. MPI-SDFR-AT-0119]|nr:hypothetical protein BKA61DRAFT_2317 [Leptodontidium sp. MPI-SDFR-AT-0119]